MATVKLVKIERKQGARGWKLVATYDDGSNTIFGTTLTEIGSKRMLARRAKQFGLTVSGNVAA